MGEQIWWDVWIWCCHIKREWAWDSGSGSGSRASGISGYSLSQQDFERNFDDLVDPEIFFEWLTGYDDQLKSEVATWLWLQNMGSDFCSHSRNLCNCDLVNQVVATLMARNKTWVRSRSGILGVGVVSEAGPVGSAGK